MNTFSDDCKTDLTDLVTFYDTISVTKAHSACDYGMLLCQSGMISRQLDEFSLPTAFVLDAVRPWIAPTPPLYDVLYDHIFGADALSDTCYDLGILLNAKSFDTAILATIVSSAFSHCRFLMIPGDLYGQYELLTRASDCIPMPAADRAYYLLVTRQR